MLSDKALAEFRRRIRVHKAQQTGRASYYRSLFPCLGDQAQAIINGQIDALQWVLRLLDELGE